MIFHAGPTKMSNLKRLCIVYKVVVSAVSCFGPKCHAIPAFLKILNKSHNVSFQMAFSPSTKSLSGSIISCKQIGIKLDRFFLLFSSYFIKKPGVYE